MEQPSFKLGETSTISGDFDVESFKVEESGKLFDIVISRIYTRKIEAVVREIGCNAYDAHAMVNSCKPPLITVPTILDVETGEMIREEKSWRAKDTSSTEFWGPLFKHEPFRDAIKARYQLGAIDSNAAVDEAVAEMINSKVSTKVDGVKLPESGSVSAAEVEDELENFMNED
jgi:hypothetical protein